MSRFSVLYLLVAVAAVITSAYRSTQYALLPSLARSPHELVAANVGLSTIEGLGMLVGPVLLHTGEVTSTSRDLS